MNNQPMVKTPARIDSGFEKFDLDEEYAPNTQPQVANEQSSFANEQSSFPNKFLGPISSFIESSATEIIYDSSFKIEQNFDQSKDGLVFDGKSFLTFERPSEDFVLKKSKETIEKAKSNLHQVEFRQTEVREVIKQENPQVKQLEQEAPVKEIAWEAKKFIPPIKEVLPIIAKEVRNIFLAFFDLFTEHISFGGGKKEAQSETQKAEGVKKAKQAENRKNFDQTLISLLRSVPITPALMQEIIKTNQLNNLQEQYQGVIDRAGNITAYHKANRIKKEAEAKAHRIAAERAIKLKSTKKRVVAGPTGQTGELLMGAENPSHFTKALG